MRAGMVFHPEWSYRARPVANSPMLARVEIWRPTGETPEWNGTDEMSGGYELVWVSRARLQPNKDWRARTKQFAGEYDAVHAIRVQVPIGGNELENQTVDFTKDYIVRVIASPIIGTENLIDQEYVVRNASLSSNAWVHNLLCDFGTRQNGGVDG